MAYWSRLKIPVVARRCRAAAVSYGFARGNLLPLRVVLKQTGIVNRHRRHLAGSLKEWKETGKLKMKSSKTKPRKAQKLKLPNEPIS